MKAEELAQGLGWEVLSLGMPQAEVEGGFAGDLLSFVMVHARQGQVWLTVMSHVNVIAVSLLAGVSGVVVCEGEQVDGEVIARAREEGVNLFRCSSSVFETASEIDRLLRSAPGA